jgi:stearoyl-CoA desaturase (delta-9 desaturase)
MTATTAAPQRAGFAWTNLWFLVAAHLAAAFAVVYMATIHFSWWTLGFSMVWGICCGLSITGGYHRLFSHGAYKAHWLVRVFYLAFGAASVQNSALRWSRDHRVHHAHTDQDDDPYDIRRGFLWAHIAWVVHRAPERPPTSTADLEADPLVSFQHKHYVALAILFAAIVPAAIGLCWGDAIGTMLVAGFLRIVVQWHATFSINSLTHMFGSRPYSAKTSARDSFWVALLTFGEGYHNFHHRFQIDYRNGVRWYHFDPTKWWIWTLARFGLTSDLRRVSDERIAEVRAAEAQSASLSKA